MDPRSLLHTARRLALFELALCTSAATAFAGDVTFRLVDQNGAAIPASTFFVNGIGLTVAQDQPVALADGEYDVFVMPGRDGAAGDTTLYRSERVAVSGAMQTLEFEWPTASYRVDVVDQFGATIPASQWVLQEGRNVFLASGTTLTLPVTSDANSAPILGPTAAGYSLQIAPGINGRVGDNRLYFVTPREALTTSSVVHPAMWPTAPFRVNVVDQFGAAIPVSQYGIQDGYGGWIPAADSVTLPITEDFGASTVLGLTASGYATWVAPGRDGRVGGDDLYRGEARVELGAAGAVHAATWITAPFRVDVVDQFGAPIVASGWWLLGGRNLWLAHATPVVLPVTENPSTPLLHGSLANGYPFLVAPGRDGVGGDDALYRSEQATELGVMGAVREATWTTVGCPLQVLDADGAPVAGSLLYVTHHASLMPMGTQVDFPITENAVYPTIAGNLANGYLIGIYPGDLPPQVGYFAFEVLTTGAFVPASVEIGGRSYSLGCQLNRPPTSDAGLNVAIVSSQQSATTLHGVASDPDGDVLTYVWKEGALALTPVAVVGAGGAADLELALLASLGVGSHVLTLEVSDGQLSAASTMQLDVGNSPPTASCSGAGTYQLGLDAVALDAVVADFDGDTIHFAWSEGESVLAWGTVSAPSGGTPVSLPTSTLQTGSGFGQLTLGAHDLTLRYDDGVASSNECRLSVQVVDTEAPTLAPTSNVLALWPPNHHMISVVIVANAHDSSGLPVVLTANVESSEDPDKDCGGHTVPDFTTPTIDQLTGTISLQLRAEREGKGRGRTYTITITATDAAGNQSSAKVRIKAPHDKKKQHDD